MLEKGLKILRPLGAEREDESFDTFLGSENSHVETARHGEVLPEKLSKGLILICVVRSQQRMSSCLSKEKPFRPDNTDTNGRNRS